MLTGQCSSDASELFDEKLKMKVLLEILGDASQLLSILDDLDDMRPQTRAELKVLLQGLCADSTRLLRDESQKACSPSIAEAAAAGESFETRCREWLMQRSLQALAAADYERALKFLTEGVEAFPEDVELWNHLGLVRWEQGEFGLAAEAYLCGMNAAMAQSEGVIDAGGETDWQDLVHQDYLRALEGRALSLCKLEAYDEALDLFDALAAMNSVDYAGCRYMAGEIRHTRGNFAAAIEDYRMGPVEPASLYNLGLAHFQHGDSQASARTFIRAFVSNIHIFYALSGRAGGAESCVPGYLGSPGYALDFVHSCEGLWAACEGGLDFLQSCFDHPRVQEYLAQRRADGGEAVLEGQPVGCGQHTWLEALIDETSVDGLAQDVMKRLYS